MVDNNSKINMSLQEIIDSNKKARNLKIRRNFGTRNTAGERRAVKVGRRIIARRPASVMVKTFKRTLGRNRPNSASVLSGAATKSLVNKLVKKAINQRANRPMLRQAVMRRRLAASSGIVVARRGIFRHQRGGLRSMGLNQRSRVIAKRVGGQRLVLSRPKIRGRGRIGGRLISDREPIVEREIVRMVRPQPKQRPPVFSTNRQREVFVEELPTRRVVVGNSARPMYVERPLYASRAAMSGRIRKRIRPAASRFVVINQQRAQRRISRNQMSRQYVNDRGNSRYDNYNNVVRMREALGITSGRPKVERFEPSSSFLQRVPVSSRRGRGFRGRFAY